MAGGGAHDRHHLAGPYRVGGEGTPLFPGANVLAGLEDVRTHDPVERRDYVEFLDRAAGYRPTDYFKKIENLDTPALDFLNVKYLISTPGRAGPGAKWRPVYSGADGTVFENASVMPRVSGPAAISAYTETVNTVSFRASVPAAAPALVATSLADDGGWIARDGAAGERLPTIRTARGGPFLALSLPPGDHRVLLEYLPPGFRAGALASAATLAAVAILLVVSRRGRPA